MTLNNGSGVSFVYITVWQEIDSKTYSFETDGLKQLGLIKVADKTYYYGGVITSNITVIDGKNSLFIMKENVLLDGRKLMVTSII